MPLIFSHGSYARLKFSNVSLRVVEILGVESGHVLAMPPVGAIKPLAGSASGAPPEASQLAGGSAAASLDSALSALASGGPLVRGQPPQQRGQGC